MALALDIMKGGFSAGAADAINGQIKASISAAGTTISDATALTASTNLLSTVASGAGVLLPNGEIGDSVEIYNGGANTCKVYPPTSLQAINQLSVGTAVSLATVTAATFRKVSTTQWIVFLSA
jgi:hypothetical protein